MTEEKLLSPLWWLWIPLGVMIVQCGLEAALPFPALDRMHSENGPHETVQAIIMISAFGVAVAGTIRFFLQRRMALAGWFVLAALCSLYVAGEEVSWGQHLFDWGTPDFWSAVNDQQETNLHNTTSWLDQKPRAILLIGIAVGGLLIPLLRRHRPGLLPQRFAVIYPPSCLYVLALLSVVPHILEKILEETVGTPFTRLSEVQELFMFYFVLLYLIALRKREIREKNALS